VKIPRGGKDFRCRAVGTNLSGTEEFVVTVEVAGRTEP